jgi:hypothetical protein
MFSSEFGIQCEGCNGFEMLIVILVCLGEEKPGNPKLALLFLLQLAQVFFQTIQIVFPV